MGGWGEPGILHLFFFQLPCLQPLIWLSSLELLSTPSSPATLTRSPQQTAFPSPTQFPTDPKFLCFVSPRPPPKKSVASLACLFDRS